MRWSLGVIQAVRHALLTCVHPRQHIISNHVTLQHVLVDDDLPSFLIYFLLKENEEIWVVFLVSEVVVILGAIIQILYHRRFKRKSLPLVGLVVVVLPLKDGRWCSQSV